MSLLGDLTANVKCDVSELVDSTAYFARFVAVNTKGSTISDTTLSGEASALANDSGSMLVPSNNSVTHTR